MVSTSPLHLHQSGIVDVTDKGAHVIHPGYIVSEWHWQETVD